MAAKYTLNVGHWSGYKANMPLAQKLNQQLTLGEYWITRSNQLRSSSGDMVMVRCRCDCIEKQSWNETVMVLAPNQAQSNRFLMYKEFPEKTKIDLYIKQGYPIIIIFVHTRPDLTP